MASMAVTSKTDQSGSDVTAQSGMARTVVRKAIQSPRVICVSPRNSAMMPMPRQNAALNPPPSTGTVDQLQTDSRLSRNVQGLTDRQSVYIDRPVELFSRRLFP